MAPGIKLRPMSRDVADILLAEWPAVLAFLVLVAGHLVSALVLGEGVRPLGIPLLVAILVFVAAEIGRAVV